MDVSDISAPRKPTIYCTKPVNARRYQALLKWDPELIEHFPDSLWLVARPLDAAGSRYEIDGFNTFAEAAAKRHEYITHGSPVVYYN